MTKFKLSIALLIDNGFLFSLLKIKEQYPNFPIEAFFPFMAIAFIFAILGFVLLTAMLLFDNDSEEL